MKIAFIGNFRVDYTSESHYLRTFERLGHQVLPIQESSDYLMNRMSTYSPDSNNPNDISPLECDIVFWVHTHGWNTPGLELFLKTFKEMGKPVVGYHLDLWKGLEREADLDTDDYWRYLDYFFTVDKLFMPDLEKRHIKGYYLPAGVVEDECYLGEYKKEYDYDVIFVGSKQYHPEWPYRTQLIDWLQKTYGSRFGLFGRDGINKAQIRGKDLNDLYASAKIVVGDTLCKNFDYPYYLSDRIFETTGRGGFIIHPYIKGLEELFELGKEIIIYRYGNLEENIMGLKGCIDYFLEHDDLRKQIQIAGHLRTKRDHTYTQRLNYILDTVTNDKNINA